MRIKISICLLFSLLGVIHTFAQEKSISGTIKNPQGLPQQGVVVSLKGDASRTTQTNAKGEYTILAKSTDILVFSSLGMATIERTVGEATTIDVVMSSSTTKATPTPSSSEAVARTNVRGPSSIYGESKPLWVVDGIILDDGVELSPDALSSSDAKTLIASALGGLSSDDIDTFRVLKDASATSIYGPRAIAGVVVVNTRKGSKGTNSISYTNESTFRLIPSYSNFNIMNSQDQMDVFMEMLRRGNITYVEMGNRRHYGEMGRMYSLLNTATPSGYGLANTDEAKGAFLRAAEMRNTDWFARLFQTSILQSHSVSFSTGTDKASYYASVGYINDPGWMRFSNYNRYTANLNANYRLSKSVSFNLIVNSSYRENKTPGSVDGVSGKVSSDFSLNPYSYALNASRTMDPKATYRYRYAPFNIFEEMENNYTNTHIGDIKIQGQLSWKISPKVTAVGLAAIRYQNISQELNQTENSNLARAYNAMDNTTMIKDNKYLYEDPYDDFDVKRSVLPEGGIREKSESLLNGKDFRGTIDY